ncbi:MAG: SDR family NAD(P)-dependent oxidoreductase [Candidatus Hodarchaeales archaeon]
MKTVFITGATGFLGNHLVASFLKRGYQVIGSGHSESNIKECERKFGDQIKLYSLDIGGDYAPIKNIIKKHAVDYIIHAAALKHVGICESSPTRAAQVNIGGSHNIIKAAIECDVKNVIGVSTDKAINPNCVYGMTKKIMEEMFLEHNFGVFQGVNFFFSTGSVLDIWDKLKKEQKPMQVDPNAVRFFCTIDDACESIVSSLECRTRFSIPKCYEISISKLQEAFSKYHDYWKVNKHVPLSIEKKIEELPLKDILVFNPTEEEIVGLIRSHYSRGISD